jgi:phage terminase large subunit GpA-like protein
MSYPFTEATVLANGARIAHDVLADVLEPPQSVDYLRWATENITFKEGESDYPGPYNPDLFPFFTEILNALSPDDPCRTVSLLKSAQLGGTILANIFVGGTMDMDPCNFLYVHPSEPNARRWSLTKWGPMVRGTPVLKRLFPGGSRDTSNSIFFKERFDGRGSIQLAGANSPAGLSMISNPRQVQDDLAKWEPNSAGDPEKQANSRSRGFEFAKIFKCSTPLIMPGCKITTNFEKGSQEHYYVPCPHCGHMHTLEWENMLASLDPDHPEKAHFTCPDCGCAIEEHDRADMVRKGEWRAHNPSAMRRHRSFYIWSAYAPLQPWVRIAEEWLDAEGDPSSEQVFLNDTVGLAYRQKGDAPPWEDVRTRAEETGHVRGKLPTGSLLLTLGMDCQKDRVEWHLIGWGRDLQRWVIDYGVVPGHISEPETQAALSVLMKSTWKNAAGRDIGIDMGAIDGNAWTEDVWDWAKKHPAGKLIMVRGVGSVSAPLLAKVKKERNRQGKLLKYSKRFFNFGTSVLKMALYRNLRKDDPSERAFVHLAKGMGDEYFRQLCSERRVAVRKNGFTTYKWVKDDNQANEGLDTMLQAEAAAIRLGVRNMPDSRWSQLEEERETSPPSLQTDLEDMIQGSGATEKTKDNEAAAPARGGGSDSGGHLQRRPGWLKRN